MDFTKEDSFDIFIREFDEEDKIGEHFSWYWDVEESTFQGYCCGYNLTNFFERSIGNAFNKKDFSVDIKTSLLNSAVDELQEFFTLKSNQDKFPGVFSELFYSEKRIVEIVCEEGVKLGFWGCDEVPEKIYEIKDLNLQIPKIKFQWLFFVIFSTKSYQGKDLKKLAQRFLKLKWTRSKAPIEIDVFYEAQERIRNFSSILKKYEMAKYEGYNLSLNLFCFNQVTNLLDLVQIFNSRDEKNLRDFKLVEIIELEGSATKSKFICGGRDGEVLYDENTLLKFNWIFRECRMLLKNEFEHIATKENYGLPIEIATAYVTYKYLLNDSTYDDRLLKDFIKLSDVENKIGSEEFENFGMLYKELHRKNVKKRAVRKEDF